MKRYKIIDTDIQHKGKLFPEGSTIDLDNKEAENLSAFLVPLGSASSQAESRDEGSPKSNTSKELKNNKRNK